MTEQTTNTTGTTASAGHTASATPAEETTQTDAPITYYLDISVITTDGRTLFVAEAAYDTHEALMSDAARFAGQPLRCALGFDHVHGTDVGDDDLNQPINGFTAEASAEQATLWKVPFPAETFGVVVRTSMMPVVTRVPMPVAPVTLRSRMGDYDGLPVRPEGLVTDVDYTDGLLRVRAWRGEELLARVHVVNSEVYEEAVVDCGGAGAELSEPDEQYLEAFALAVDSEAHALRVAVFDAAALRALNDHVAALGVAPAAG